MSQDLQRALALIFRRFRDKQVSETELIKVISLTLGWAKPSQAPYLLYRGVEAGLLERDGDRYRPSFDPNSVELPFGFRPEQALFEPVEGPEQAPGAPAPSGPSDPSERVEEPEEEGETPGGPDQPTTEPDGDDQAGTSEDEQVLEGMLDAIAGATGTDRKAAVAKVNAKQETLGGLVTLDAAALVVAAELGLDVEEHARSVMQALKVE